MIGLGQMVGGASRILYGDEARVQVEVHANFRRALFGVDFFAVSSQVGLLPPLDLPSLAAIATLIGVGGGAVKGLIQLVRWQRGRRIDRVGTDGDLIQIQINNEVQEVTVNQYRILIDPDARKGLGALVSPLTTDDVDLVELQKEDDPPIVIPSNEAASFTSSPLPEQEISIR